MLFANPSVPPKLNLDIFGKANKIVHLACKNFIGSQVPDSRVQPFRCFADGTGMWPFSSGQNVRDEAMVGIPVEERLDSSEARLKKKALGFLPSAFF